MKPQERGGTAETVCKQSTGYLQIKLTGGKYRKELRSLSKKIPAK
jgi:hypothetical protein